MIEYQTFTSYEQTKSGKGYQFTAEGARGRIYCFEPKVAKDVLDHLNVPVQVDIDRTPNDDGKVFPKIKSFHGSAGDAPAPAAAAAPSSTTHTAHSQRGGSGSSFKKDPIGIVLGSRQTALNAAVAYFSGLAKETREEMDGAVLHIAQEFNEFLLAGLSPHILSDGLHVSNVMPWREDLRAAENALAKAALVNPASVDGPLRHQSDREGFNVPTSTVQSFPEDDIPF